MLTGCPDFLRPPTPRALSSCSFQVEGSEWRGRCPGVSTGLGGASSQPFIDFENCWCARTHWPWRSINAKFIWPEGCQVSRRRPAMPPATKESTNWKCRQHLPLQKALFALKKKNVCVTRDTLHRKRNTLHDEDSQ